MKRPSLTRPSPNIPSAVGRTSDVAAGCRPPSDLPSACVAAPTGGEALGGSAFGTACGTPVALRTTRGDETESPNQKERRASSRRPG